MLFNERQKEILRSLARKMSKLGFGTKESLYKELLERYVSLKVNKFEYERGK